MNIDKLVFRVAGVMVTVGAVLAYTHHIAWLALPIFVVEGFFALLFNADIIMVVI